MIHCVFGLQTKLRYLGLLVEQETNKERFCEACLTPVKKKKKKIYTNVIILIFLNELVILLNSTKTPTEVFFNQKLA